MSPAVCEELGWIAAQAAMVDGMVAGMEAVGHMQDGYWVPDKLRRHQLLQRQLISLTGSA